MATHEQTPFTGPVEDEPMRFVGMAPDSRFDPGTQEWETWHDPNKPYLYRRISSGMVIAKVSADAEEQTLSWSQFMEWVDG